MKTIITLLLGSVILFSQELTAQGIEAKPLLKITATAPKAPAELTFKQRFVVSLDYNNPGPEAVLIFVRPYTKGAKTQGEYVFHASKVYPKGEGKIEGDFTFFTPVVVDEVRVTMVDAKTRKEVSVLKVPADLKWK